MDIIWTLAGVAGLGGIGYVALIFFAPLAAASVGQFLAVIIDTRAGIAVIAVTSGLFAGDVYRATRDHSIYTAKIVAVNAEWRKKIDRAAQDFEDARRTRDAAVRDALDEANRKRQADIDNLESGWEGRLKAFQDSLVNDPACTITKDDARR